MSTKVGTAQRHDSALKHVTGQALYIDDIPEPPGTLHGALVLSTVACGRLKKLGLAAVATSPGVVAVLAADDVPGRNDVAPIGQGEPLFAMDRVDYAGQPLAMVVAESLDAARAAAERAVVEIEEEEPILDIATALAKKAYVQAPATLLRGDPENALDRAPHRLTAEFSVGGQEHFYLEGQIAFALPGEDGDIVVHSSTQHPTEVQHICARLLGCDFNRITAVVRRLGGGFGGKESNASWVAGAAAVAANHTGRPVKLRLPREIDMIATGKRHGFDYRYTVGFDDEGRVLALDAELAADAGWSLDCFGTFGMGGALLQKVNRDTFSFAQKASWGVVDGEARAICKRPQGDPGKASKAGRIASHRHRGDGRWCTAIEGTLDAGQIGRAHV